MKREQTEFYWPQKICKALKFHVDIVCILHNQDAPEFLVFYTVKMDDATKHCVENLENQMDKVIRISNSLNKKISTATSQFVEPRTDHISDQENCISKKGKDIRDMRVRNIVSQNEDLRHIAQTLTLELERARNIEKTLRAENCKLVQEKDSLCLEIGELQAREIVTEKNFNFAKDSLQKVKLENESLKQGFGSNEQKTDGKLSTQPTAHEVWLKCEEMKVSLKTEVNGIKQDFESRKLLMQNEIDQLRMALADKDSELRNKLQEREREVEQKYVNELDTMRNEYRKILNENEALVLKENSLQAEGQNLGKDLRQAKASLEKAREENDILKQEFRAEENIALKIEETEISKRFEEVKASYDERINVLQEDFESRRLIMVSEIQRLRTAVTHKDTELRCEYEANEREMKEKCKNEMEQLTKKYRALLEEKEKLTLEMCSMQGEDQLLGRTSNETLKEIRCENELLKRELTSCRQQMESQCSLKREAQDLKVKLIEMKSSYENLIENLQKDFEYRDSMMKKEVDILRSELVTKELDSQGRLQDNDIKEKLVKHLETLSEDNLVLLKDKEKTHMEVDSLRNQESLLQDKLKTTGENLAKLQVENESLRKDLIVRKRHVEEIVQLNFEKQDLMNEMESMKSNHKDQIQNIRDDFESRRLVMMNEIEKLRTVLADRGIELRDKLEKKEKEERERASKHIENLTIELRKYVEDKEKLILEIGCLRSREKIVVQNLNDAEESREVLRAEHETLKRELESTKQQIHGLYALKYEEEEAKIRFEKMRSMFEDRIHALQKDFETRRLVMVNEIEKLRTSLASKDEEVRRKLDEKESEVKESYEKLVVCLSNELKRTLADAKQNEDLIHEKWNAKLAECREQMKRNMVCLEKQIEISTNNASLRNNQLTNERDDLKSRILTLETEIERGKRHYEVNLLQKDKKIEEVDRERCRASEELKHMKDALSHKDTMIDVLQDTVRKECTEREDILRKLDDIRKSSSQTTKDKIFGPVTTSEGSVKGYTSSSGSKQPIFSFERVAASAKRQIPGYMVGVPLILPQDNCISASKCCTPCKFPSTPKMCNSAKGSNGSRTADLLKICRVGCIRDMEFTVGKGRMRKNGKLARTRSLQSPSSYEAYTRSDGDHSPQHRRNRLLTNG